MFIYIGPQILNQENDLKINLHDVPIRLEHLKLNFIVLTYHFLFSLASKNCPHLIKHTPSPYEIHIIFLSHLFCFYCFFKSFS